MDISAPHRLRLALVVATALCVLPLPCRSQDTNASADLADKSIEELMNVDVTTVARKEQKLSKVPGAVYVVTQEMIQRSGANNIPDLLRAVPGVQVAQVEADRWAISIRGFNGSYSNKLLVLVDGRTVYTPSFSGVYWDQLDIPLDTIERIEVVRGSAGAVWGANAVNGVINIITMHSQDTKGGKAEVGSGSQETKDFIGRFGGKIGNWGSYRIVGDYRDFNGFQSQYSSARPDAWEMEHGGFRIDGRLSSKDQLTLDGDGYSTKGGELLGFAGNSSIGVAPDQLDNHGLHVLGKWTHTYSDNSESTLQIYDNEYDRIDTGIREWSNTVDIDFQNRTKLGSRNDLVFGGGYRFTSDDAKMIYSPAQSLANYGLSVILTPEAKQYSLFSGFLQDEITLTKTLSLTAGSKVEHNAFSGLEMEPTVRLAWTPNERNTLWASASHSIRQPNRLETAINVSFPVFPLVPGLALLTDVTPDPGIEAERSNSFEAGYRWFPNKRLSFDLATFYTRYSKLHVDAFGTPTLVPSGNTLLLTVGNTYAATGTATNYGAEVSATADVTGRWKLTGEYSWLQQSGDSGQGTLLQQQITALLGPAFYNAFGSSLTATIGTSYLAGSAPNQSAGLLSYFDVTRRWSFNQSVFYVGELSAVGIPSYVRLDLNTSYKLPHGLQLSLVGQNLLSPRHLEFEEPSQLVPTEPERTIFGKLTWTF